MEMDESEECTEDEVTRGLDSSSETSEDDEEVDDCVQEDMNNLEDVFNERGLKYRMINRIGEGSLLGRGSLSWTERLILALSRNVLHCLQSRRLALRLLSE